MEASPRPPLAQRVKEGSPLYGLIVKMPNQALVEQAAYLGFDLIVIDCEHGLGDGEQLEHHLRAADSVRIHTLVRVGSAQSIDVLRSLDSGAHGVIIPHVDTAEQARLAVQYAHYPPVGLRGLASSTRAGRYSTTSLAAHIQRSLSETVVIAQIEHVDAVPNTRSIASTPYVNAVWLGPIDLSMSLGQPGRMDHPDVVSAVDAIVSGINSVKDTAFCVLATNADDVRRWTQRGASIFLFAAPELIARSLRELLSSVRST